MKKFLALTLSLALIISTIVTCMLTQATENWEESTSKTGLCYFPIENIACKSTEYVTQSLSEMGDGVDGSYAMKLTSDITTSKRSTIMFSNNSRTVFGDGGTFRIEFKIKKAEGSISKNNGISDNGFAIGFNSSAQVNNSYWHWAGYLNDEDLSTAEFKSYSLTVDLTNTTGWYYLSIRYFAGDNGATLLLDDMKVYKVENTTETLVAFESDMEADCDFDLDQTYYSVPVEDDSHPAIVYTAASGVGDRTGTTSTHSSYADYTAPAIVSGGVDGSNAVQIGAVSESGITDYRVVYQTRYWQSASVYTISMDVKRTSGEIGTFKIALNDYTEDSLTLDNSRISDNWTTISFNVNIEEYTATSAPWVYLLLTLNAPEGGAQLLIDNVKVTTVTDGATDVKFNTATTTCNMTFDAKVEYKLTDTCGEYAIINNVIFIPQLNTQAQALKTACNAPESVTVSILDGDAALADTDVLKTDTVLSATVEGNETTYAIAVKNDVNSNGEFNITDLVKADEIMNGAEATLAQIVAAGANDGAISTTQIGAIITALLSKN